MKFDYLDISHRLTVSAMIRESRGHQSGPAATKPLLGEGKYCRKLTRCVHSVWEGCMDTNIHELQESLSSSPPYENRPNLCSNGTVNKLWRKKYKKPTPVCPLRYRGCFRSVLGRLWATSLICRSMICYLFKKQTQTLDISNFRWMDGLRFFSFGVGKSQNTLRTTLEGW